MRADVVGTVSVERCNDCRGVWLKASTFNELTVNFEWQREIMQVVRERAELRRESGDDPFPLLCPMCRQAMNRTNLGRTSGIMVDSCRKHGIWFDVGELHGTVDYLMDQERVEKEELERQITLALSGVPLPSPQPWSSRLVSFLADLFSD